MASQYYTPLSNGLQSFADASPEYEFADAGIGSFQEQASRLAEFGRNGDIYVVHAAEGETVIPTEVLEANPKVRELLFEQMRGMGLDPQEYVVGNELNSRNPVTGMPEFFFKSIFKSVKKAIKKVWKFAKKVAPVVLPLAAAAFGVPFLPQAFFGPGMFGSTFLGSGIGSLIGGASIEDSIKSGLMAGATAAVGSGLKTAFTAGGEGTFLGNLATGTTEAVYNPGAGGWNPFAAAPDAVGTPKPDFSTSAQFAKARPLTSENIRAYTDGVETNAELFNRGFDFPAPDAVGTPKPDFSTSAQFSSPKSNFSGGAPLPKVTNKPPLPLDGEESWYDTFTKYAFQGGKSDADLEGRGQIAYNKVFSNAKAQGVPVTSETMKIAEAARAAAMDPGALAKYGPLLAAGGIGYLALGGGEEVEQPKLKSLAAERNKRNPLLEEDRKLPVGQKKYIIEDIDPYKYAPPDAPVSPYTEFKQMPRRRPVMYSNQGGLAQYPRRDMLVEGPGTERSDDIPAMLSDGEFVLNARSVRGADPTGQGNRHRGAQNLYRMMRDFEMKA